ncbi:N-acyl amino acid synthase FeeM domain-containing protein [Stieleria neptunia]|uniref:N-acyl amino acid synthase FeeM domain-containing protein n=1 Tax=Stieleria neptunia TaxID=2527979 RepID=UPI0011A50DED|nr:hypothetical protein [Stieleria neptunia]
MTQAVDDQETSVGGVDRLHARAWTAAGTRTAEETWAAGELFPVQCFTARSLHDYEAAFRTLHDSYVKAGLCDPTASGMRVLPFHLWRETQVFSGRADQKRVATLSLVLDEHHRLPMEEVFEDVVQREREANELTAELSSFAVAPDYSKPRTEHLVAMTAAAVQFARRQGVDDLLATVHPKHVRIYRRIMGFRQIGEVAPHGGVMGRPAVPIAAPVNDIRAVHPRFLPWYFGDRIRKEQVRRSYLSERGYRYFRPFARGIGNRRYRRPR